MSKERLELIKENVYMRSEIAKISEIGIDTSLKEELELIEEIDRLNNIINELENELDRGYKDLFDMKLVPGRELIINIKNYLNELKENM